MTTSRSKDERVNLFLEVGIWLLFFALLAPAGFVDYEIGRAQSAPAPPAHAQVISG